MKLQTFYVHETYNHGRVAKAKPMQGYHRQINGVSVYVAKYAGVWRAYDEDSGRWLVQEKTMKGAIASAEKYIARADAAGCFTSEKYKGYCKEFLDLRRKAQ